jgi:hypothetical protein
MYYTPVTKGVIRLRVAGDANRVMLGSRDAIAQAGKWTASVEQPIVVLSIDTRPQRVVKGTKDP